MMLNVPCNPGDVFKQHTLPDCVLSCLYALSKQVKEGTYASGMEWATVMVSIFQTRRCATGTCVSW